MTRRISILLAIVACSGDKAPVAIPDETAWRAALLDDRAKQEVENKTSVTSAFAAIERHVLAAAMYVEVRDDGLRLEGRRGDATAVAFEPGWSWSARDGVTAETRDGKPVAPGPLTAPTVIRLGRYSLLSQPVEGSMVVTIYDAKAETLQHYRGLSHFAPEPRFAVSAKVERRVPPEPVKLPTMIGLEKSFVRYATLRFDVAGKQVALTAFQPVGARSLFVPFRDATSGKASYGAGRYLDLEVPEGDRIVIDFNRAYNPLCAYSPAFNCPIPPVENHLAVAIEAGERTYDGPH